MSRRSSRRSKGVAPPGPRGEGRGARGVASAGACARLVAAWARRACFLERVGVRLAGMASFWRSGGGASLGAGVWEAKSPSGVGRSPIDCYRFRGGRVRFTGAGDRGSVPFDRAGGKSGRETSAIPAAGVPARTGGVAGGRRRVPPRVRRHERPATVAGGGWGESIGSGDLIGSGRPAGGRRVRGSNGGRAPVRRSDPRAAPPAVQVLRVNARRSCVGAIGRSGIGLHRRERGQSVTDEATGRNGVVLASS